MRQVRAKSVSAVLVGWVLAASPIATIGSGNPHPSADRCADVTASGRIPLKDRVLVETPDIDAPELRLVNALVSARCFDNVQPLLEKYTADHPDDYREYFVDALVPRCSRSHATHDTRHAARGTRRDFTYRSTLAPTGRYPFRTSRFLAAVAAAISLHFRNPMSTYDRTHAPSQPLAGWLLSDGAVRE